MAEYDDNEHRAAYERARDYAEFANIVQHYDDTARPNHDDIDYDAPDHDGTEYDDNGDIVALVGVIGGVLYDIADAIEQFGSFDDIPDDYDFSEPDDGWDPFGSDEDDGDGPCQFIFLIDFVRRSPNQCSRDRGYVAPGDDDDDPRCPAA